MTPEEEFEGWWFFGDDVPNTETGRNLALSAWLASREATAKRCVEILNKCEYKPYAHILMIRQCAEAIEREFGVGK